MEPALEEFPGRPLPFTRFLRMCLTAVAAMPKPPESMFGKFLVDRGLLQESQLREALEAQEKSHVFFGRIAYEMKLMNLDEIMMVLELQNRKSTHFGELAVELGILDATQVITVLNQQEQMHVPLGQMLARLGMLDPERLDRELTRYHEIKEAKENNAAES